MENIWNWSESNWKYLDKYNINILEQGAIQGYDNWKVKLSRIVYKWNTSLSKKI